MKPWNVIGKTGAPGASQLTLYEHDGEHVLRVGGRELMSTRRTASEVRLAELGCQGLSRLPKVRVLIGGLGLGFTLRAALAAVGRDAEVVVAELLPAVVEWNQNPDLPLASKELQDRRTRVVVGDVADTLRAQSSAWDAILLDADNGTTAMMTRGNRALYETRGLATVHAALRPGGRVVYWSAEPDDRFAKRMVQSGFQVTSELVRAYSIGGPKHQLLLGMKVAKA